jgi:hypothetical protein
MTFAIWNRSRRVVSSLAALILIVGCTSAADPRPVTLVHSEQTFPPAATNQIRLGDLDGDGDLDAVFSNQGPHDSQVWFNDGAGVFTDSGQRLTTQGHGAGLGDLDADGDLDLFLTCAGYYSNNLPTKVYLNDGRGRFIDSQQDLGDVDISGNGVTLVDIDSDGDLDAHVWYYTTTALPYSHRVYLNDGAGHFQLSEIALPEGSHLFWGDLDGDHTPDVFAMEWDRGLRALTGDGRGHFTSTWEFPDPHVQYGDVGLGDLDRDGDLDALVSWRGNTVDDSTRVFFNDGHGRFSESTTRLPPVLGAGITLVDFNGDRTLDAYLSTFRGPNLLWLNTGDGHFVDSGQIMCASEPNAGVGIGDLDSDGTPDVFVSFYGEGSNSIWFNRHR